MTRKYVLGLTLLCPMLCAACSATKTVAEVPVIHRVAPPAYLMEPTPEPGCKPVTNGDLVDCYTNTRDALRAANADKAAIKAAVAAP